MGGIVTCHHQSRIRDRGQFTCALGWYGGKPWLGNCNQCMAAGRNTLEAKAAADSRADRAHPSSLARLSGCCDRADQA
jgi:hypothetical protein